MLHRRGNNRELFPFIIVASADHVLFVSLRWGTQESLGYAGAYCQRSGGKSDGCATFVLRQQAVLVEEEGVAYKVQGHPVLDR